MKYGKKGYGTQNVSKPQLCSEFNSKSATVEFQTK